MKLISHIHIGHNILINSCLRLMRTHSWDHWYPAWALYSIMQRIFLGYIIQINAINVTAELDFSAFTALWETVKVRPFCSFPRLWKCRFILHRECIPLFVIWCHSIGLEVDICLNLRFDISVAAIMVTLTHLELVEWQTDFMSWAEIVLLLYIWSHLRVIITFALP